MAFVLQRVEGRKFALNEVRGKLLRIGRGTNQELRSENPAVALEHATIEGDANGYTITDKGSITGTYVNRKPVEFARLAVGDVIEIGDLRIEVQRADAAKPLFLRVVSTVSQQAVTPGVPIFEDEALPAVAGAAQVKAPKIDYADAYRLRRSYLTKTTLVALMLILALAAISEVVRPENHTAFMPGGVSSAHAHAVDPVNNLPVAPNCKNCHDPFRGVTNTKCMTCHTKEPHSQIESHPPACMDCHGEHRGSVKLAMIPDRTCVSCHADIASHVLPGSKVEDRVAKVTAFDSAHPEFVYPKADPDPLRFNHKLHLQPRGMLNDKGKREVLTCVNCHRLVTDKNGKADPAALNFGEDCQRCHRLTFDARFPDAEVPHGGDPGLVYGFVVGTYSGNRDIVGKTPEEVRRILTNAPPTSVDERAVLNAEQVIKTRCTLCHDIARRAGKLAATPPVIVQHWLEHARYSHTEHRNLECTSCHAAALGSSATSDVLLPSRKDCTPCHGGRDGSAASTCVTCHEYHERSKMLLAKMAPAFASRGRGGSQRTESGGGFGMIGTILLIAIVILLLVVLLPIGIALYQKISRSEAPPAQPRAAAPAPPPLRPQAAAPAAAPPQAAPAPAPRPASPPPADATQMANIPQAGAPVQGGATEMVQWYGMITCTQGVLEGQRWVVEEDGFYIGRDPALSKVVINDGRISKRHVRIVPRDGKVHAIDQNSTNGTFLGKAGGEKISDVQLRRGDVIVLADGAATFLYQV